MTVSDLIDPSEYEAPPRTEAEWRREVWRRLGRIEAQTKATNGRVTRLERLSYSAGGGLLVLSLIVIPIFINLVNG